VAKKNTARLDHRFKIGYDDVQAVMFQPRWRREWARQRETIEKLCNGLKNKSKRSPAGEN
jgi:hypothetical protein